MEVLGMLLKFITTEVQEIIMLWRYIMVVVAAIGVGIE